MDCFQLIREKDIEYLKFVLPGALAVFSTRQGGISRPPFDTLNLAFHVGDERESIAANREAFAAAVGFSLDRVVCADQIHGTNIQVVTQEDCGRGAFRLEDAVPETDALITADKGVILAGFFADCVPIYISDPVKGVVALVHAGWKGTVKEIAGKTVGRMSGEFSCSPADCYALIGPSIGPCCYTVGEEVAAKFKFGPEGSGKAVKKQGDKWILDLWAANRNVLLSSGLLPERIQLSRVCTRCGGKFFSYRGDGGCTGRMAAFIKPL
ncbi:MAG TPA: peptidoglycan editing factor PgeF [Clostridia bacterium]|nr:peptidoglycan editing factor PgeF [Clostridia bacterium]